MERKTSLLGLALAVSALLFGLCGPAVLQSSAFRPTPTPIGGSAQLANPAAVFCEEQGYSSEIRTAADGSQYGVCVFSNGTECDEWAFFRGQCGSSSR
jgi:putative hemolysin